jgi:ribose transport system substrate-binding protein
VARSAIRSAFALLACSAVLLPLAACGDGSAAAGGKTYRISVIVGVKGDDFYGSLACGAKAAAKRLDAKVDVQGPNKWDAPEQISVLKSVQASKPDAIVIAPVDDTALQAPLEQAKASGIKIILVDTGLRDNSVAAARITSNDELAGRDAAKAVLKLTGGKGAVVTVNTQPGVSTVDARVRGFQAGLKEASGIDYLGQKYSGDDPAKASSVVTSTLAGHPGLAAVFATNTLTGQGAATGVKNAQRTGKIKLVGFDANPSGVQALEEGAAQAQVVLKPLDIGTFGVEQAVNALSGKPVKKLIHTGALVASKDNLAKPEVKKYLYHSNCAG